MKNLRLPYGVGLSILVGAPPRLLPFNAINPHVSDPIIVTITQHEAVIGQLTFQRNVIGNLSDDIQAFLDVMYPPKMRDVHAGAPLTGPRLVK
jgi:hypothetical protein